jgi:hypothetical protein
VVVAATMGLAAMSLAARLPADQAAGCKGLQRLTGVAVGAGDDFDPSRGQAIDGARTNATYDDRADAKAGHEAGHAASLAVSWAGHDPRGDDLTIGKLRDREKGRMAEMAAHGAGQSLGAFTSYGYDFRSVHRFSLTAFQHRDMRPLKTVLAAWVTSNSRAA